MRSRWQVLAGSVVVVFLLRQGWLLQPIREAQTAEIFDLEDPTSVSDLGGRNLAHSERLSWELVPKRTNVENPLDCHETSSGGTNVLECCGSWEVDADDFWIQHPTWEITRENATSYCMCPIQDVEKADFIREIHWRQWQQEDPCREVETSMQQNSGFGAATRWLMMSFYHAYLGSKPFQIEWGKRRWLYATENRSSWAYCASEDITCYYLPISPCYRNATGKSLHYESRPNEADNKQARQFFWLGSYMMRPRHVFRKKLYEMRAKLNVTYPCTTMHVRRGDSGLPRPPFRRYAAVAEYIEKAELQKGDTIVLLTDDETTIEEVERFHKKDYNWVYLDRPRNRGVKAGFNGHIPSGDEGFEMLAIETELRIGGSCDKIVCGRSGFMESLVQTMLAEGKNFSLYFVDTRVTKEEARKFGAKARQREKSLLKDIEKANKKLSAG
ncbi:expressed unknown protein [Seminavis robusta]|uniref:Uncharacterized protein n=1 Tax=Seminavis robusta TaxID=568900 RepID=A0A9N8E0N0_9STRA|nr:expressed unknown protein [Seminavis robusta]|eukprot:Sro502_g155620.1 n/a (442) ;mRNA; r:43471-45014